jgi:hypothetical protein
MFIDHMTHEFIAKETKRDSVIKNNILLYVTCSVDVLEEFVTSIFRAEVMLNKQGTKQRAEYCLKSTYHLMGCAAV